ncbi:MAG: hypothetical protein AABX71_02050 [Nanoarchaeota archaeon]
MKVLGFNFDKISAEKLKERTENLKISTNLDVSDIKEIKTDILKTKEGLLQAKFSYIIKYEPGLANLELRGAAILALEEKQAKEVLKEWKKKQMPEYFKVFLFNTILRRASLKSLHLEEEMGLPYHIPFPSISPNKEK